MTVFTHPGASMEVQLIHVPTYMLSASQVMSLLWTCNMISCTVEHAVPTYRMLPLRLQSRSVSAAYLTYPISLKLTLPSCFASSSRQQSNNRLGCFRLPVLWPALVLMSKAWKLLLPVGSTLNLYKHCQCFSRARGISQVGTSHCLALTGMVIDTCDISQQ